MNYFTSHFLSVCLLAILLPGSTTNAGQSRIGDTPTPLAEINPPAVEQYYPVDSGVHWVGLVPRDNCLRFGCAVDSGVHWVGLVLDRGAKVKLEDGSLWEIAEKDQLHTRDWRVAQKITVSRNPNSRHPFILTNTDQKASADARLAARPK